MRLPQEQLTNTMSTWALAIALRPELIALIASSTDTSPNRAGGSSTIGPPIANTTPTIGMLTMFLIVAPMDLRVLVHVDMLLKLLEGILGAMSERIQARMHVVRL